METVLHVSDRELDVLSLLACGLSNSSIAGILVLSTRTVVHHVEHLMQKLNVTSRSGCARIAFEFGLLRLEDLDRA
ncbi:response regulator transcription factor [Mycolicibacterium sp.]|uniref:response regulator transcription factor n=1 Tax=Mycolicibacterium sp. TaxID=2320850 RepID=UPI003D0E4A2B